MLKLIPMNGKKIIARNRKARFEYDLLELYEAGIELKGSEIKSIRKGQVSLSEAYVRTNGKQAWLVGAHIAPYEQANIFNHEPDRDRRLLLHKREIRTLWDAVRMKGVTIIPTALYLRDGLAKVEIALAKGKRLYDKRQDLKKRDMTRDMERVMESRSRGNDR